MSTQTNDVNDIDPIETQEWLDAMSSVLESEGTERAHFLLENLVKYTRRRGVHLPFDATTAYLNTIPVIISLLEDGRHLAVLIGVNGQIVVILRSRIAHDELGRAARLKLSQPDIVHRIGQALYGLAHLPGTPAVLA